MTSVLSTRAAFLLFLTPPDSAVIKISLKKHRTGDRLNRTRRGSTRNARTRLLVETLEERLLLTASSVEDYSAAQYLADNDWLAPSAAPTLSDNAVVVAAAQSASLLNALDAGEGGELISLPGEWIVRFADVSGSPEDQIRSIRQATSDVGLEVSVRDHLGLDGMFLIETPRELSYEQLHTGIDALPGYLYAEPNWVGSWVGTVSNDPLFGALWGLKNSGQSILGTPGTPGADINASAAWDLSTGTTRAAVGVIDSGIDYTHPDLYLNVWINQDEIPLGLRGSLVDVTGDGLITFHDLNHPANAAFTADLNGNGRIDAYDLLNDPQWADGVDTAGNGFVDDLVGWNFETNTNNPLDLNGHGTHVSGTIGAVGDNGLGVAGVNWTTQLIGLAIGTAAPTLARAVQALNYVATMAEDFGVRVVATNNSYGIPFSQALLDAVTRNRDADVLLVASAGNNNTNSDTIARFPANLEVDNVIAVAATTNQDLKATYSNFGANTVHLGAPGHQILSTVPGGGYAYFNGTSMAAPHVAGVAALASAVAPGLGYAGIRSAILEGVDPITSMAGITVTGGRLNAFNTLKMLQDIDVVAFPSPLEATRPLGSLVYEGSTSGFIVSAEDTDGFTVLVDPGQTITAVVTPGGGLQPTVEISVLEGDLEVLLAGASAQETGQAAILQTVATHGSLITPGNGAPPKTYLVRVAGIDGSTGSYELQLILNAAVEEESHGGAPNGTLDTAQELNSAFLPLLGSFVDVHSSPHPERAVVLGSLTGATSTTVPGNLERVEGDASNAWPLHIGVFGQPSMRYQQIYSASEFAVGGLIDALRFRRNLGQAPFSTAGIDVQINLGYAATTVATASPVFGNNIGAEYVTVFDGLLDLSSNASGSPNPFDIVIDVADLFHFDPAQGDLLVDIYLRNSPLTGFFDASGFNQQSATTRIVSFPGNVNATSGFVGSNTIDPRPYGLVTQFDFVPANDWYSFTLEAGESTTLALSSLSGANVGLQLVDDSGMLLAEGVSTGITEGPELIVNGSFETGTFAAWNVTTTGSAFRPWQVTAGGFGGGFGMATTSPLDGNYVAWNGFDGGGPMEFVMSQDVAIPAGQFPELSWQERVQWNFSLGGFASLPRTHFVEVRDPATNAILATVHEFSTGTQATNPTGDTGWTTQTADLSDFSGQTVRLVFRQHIPQAATGPGQIEFDAISLRDPSVPAGDQIIRNFIAPATGTYYARIASDAETDYSLLVTRNTQFDLQPGNSLATAKNVLSTEAAGRQWVMGHIQSPQTTFETEHITFSEISPRPAHGATIKGVTFDYRIGGLPSNVASIGLLSGPGTTRFVTPPLLEGDAAGTLTMDFDQPVSSLEFGVLRNWFGTMVNAVLVQLFDPNLNLIATIPITTRDEGFNWSEALFTYSGELVQRAVLNFNQTAARFVLDNLKFEREVVAPFEPSNFFAITVDNRPIRLETFTPGDREGDFDNRLNPMLRIYDAAGNLVASDDNSAPDGRNARLMFRAPRNATGTYFVEVTASGATETLTGGEYFLTIQGNTATYPDTVPVMSAASTGSVASAEAAIAVSNQSPQSAVIETLVFGQFAGNASQATPVNEANNSPPSASEPDTVWENHDLYWAEVPIDESYTSRMISDEFWLLSEKRLDQEALEQIDSLLTAENETSLQVELF